MRKSKFAGATQSFGAGDYALCSDKPSRVYTFEENHVIIFNIIWEMVASTDVHLKINATKLLKVIVPYIDPKLASSHVLPALVTLGSDQNLNVKYANIDAFGAVAQHFKNEMIVDKIRIQMDYFLEDRSHEASVAVIRALLVAVPHTTDKLRDYIIVHFLLGLFCPLPTLIILVLLCNDNTLPFVMLNIYLVFLDFCVHLLSKIFQFTGSPASSSDISRRRERANAFSESICALDATDLLADVTEAPKIVPRHRRQRTQGSVGL